MSSAGKVVSKSTKSRTRMCSFNVNGEQFSSSWWRSRLDKAKPYDHFLKTILKYMPLLSLRASDPRSSDPWDLGARLEAI